MKRIIEITHEDELNQIVGVMIDSKQKLVLLQGDLGAGKTTLAKAFFRAVGVEDDHMSSPSFGLINSYELKEGGEAHHVDLYRLKDEEEAYELGLEEYLDSDEYVLIEWPEILENLWTEMSYLSIFIEQLNSGNRRFILSEHLV